MYFPAGNRIVALDADTGTGIMVLQARQAGRAGPRHQRRRQRVLGARPRLLARRRKLRPAPAGDRRNKLVGSTRRPAKPAAGFGDDGAVDIDPAYGGAPTIYKNVAIIGAATLENPITATAANPRAYDVRTGKKLWEFQTVPHPGPARRRHLGQRGLERPRRHQPVGGLGPGRRGSAASPTCRSAIPAANYWGGDRPGNNLFGNSIVARRCAHRQVPVALPDRAPRPVGYGHAQRRPAVQREAQRQERAGHRPGQQDQPVLRARPRHRQAGIAGRRAPGSQGRRARRMVQPDAAVPANHSPARARCR